VNGAFSVAQVRAAEQSLMALVPPGALMQRAAYALSVQCAHLLGPVYRVYGARIVVLAGSGDNGGDALYAGAELARRGARVTAILVNGDRAHAGGSAALGRNGGRIQRAGDPDGEAELIGAADLVIDGILGIGGRGGLREPAARLAAAASRVLTVAVDIPSGVDADTGAVEGAVVRADVTVVMGALKVGLVAGAGPEYTGELRLADIGLAPHLPAPTVQVLEAADVAAVLPVPGPTDDKYTRGVLGVVAGSPGYPGAGVLATGAALHGGAGMIRYLGLAPDGIRARYPEVVVQADARPGQVRVQAWVIGPGLGVDEAARSMVAEVLATDVPVIVDADAITLVAKRLDLVRNRAAPTVLTPHDREFTRLGVELSADRIGSAQRAAASLGVTMLLKGNATVIAASDGTTYVNRTGTPWLATAGSGDVLSGLLGSLLASGIDAPLAAAVAAHVHGLAGQLAAGGGPPSAADVRDQIRPALELLENG
jgi:ADP-dependent NAD(P)H-hydrate dehydratase / NAD(P)H-hydrate epimerase